ncbi:MAG: MBL fold metallo-hydrolase, partial [Bacteroidia bacterium]|nr:MBL fold metallo-hydrolase [Bacteroidia bacterium]
QEYVKKDPDPFGFNNLHYITKAEDSIRLNNTDEACIIISASGMMEAGRVKHHIKNSIGKEKNTILIVGYCAPNTLGRHLMDGKKEVKIFGEPHQVKAEVKVIASYSAHADYLELQRFLSCQETKKVKKVFLVHGEANSKIAFREKLLEQGFPSVEIPAKGVTFELE